MRKITLQQLRCHEQEDWTGSDAVQLEVTVDGDERYRLRRDMEEGDRWRPNKAFKFESRVRFRLIERDVEGDDLIGEHDLEVPAGTSLPWTDRIRFRGDDAHYALRFKIEDAPGPDHGAGSVEDQARQLVHQFAAASGDGAWRHISRQELAAALLGRIGNAVQVDQHTTPFCGPAAIEYELVRRDPDIFARMVIDLWERGAAETRDGAEIEPSADTRNSPVPRSFHRSGSADWVFCASIRDAENLFWDVQGDPSTWRSQLAGLTTQWEMAGWCESVLGMTNVEIENTYTYGEADAAHASRRAIRDGGVGFWMIDGDLVRRKEPTLAVPTHWIVHEGPFTITDPWGWDNGEAKFRAWTWGRNPRWYRPSEGQFEDCMFAVVWAKP